MTEYFPADCLTDSQKRLEALIGQNRAELDSLCAQPLKTYRNFVRPYMDASHRISVFFTPIAHMQGVKNDERSQAAFTSCISILTAYSTELSHDRRVYDAFAEIRRNEYDHLSQAARKVLDDAIFDFELEGVNLPEDRKEEIKTINIRLSELADTFNQNLLNATNAYKIKITEKDELGEMPESDRAAAKKKDGWEFGLQMPSYIAFMTYVTNRDKREEVYRAYCTRAPENEKLIPEILSLRHQKAAILGYGSYADLNLRTMSAPSVDGVLRFLETLAEAGKPPAAKEMDRLKEYAARENIHDIAAHDTAYYAHKLKKQEYDYDEEALRPYFEMDSAVNGLFSVLERLFGISFTEKPAKLWDDTAKYYEVSRGGEPSGALYLDLLARPDKRGGAWMDNWKTYHRDAQDRLHLPHVFVVGNFPPPSGAHPSLLRHDDVRTLFHEMGHALHHLMSRVDEEAVSGVNGIDWDTVEFPSQFLENFAYAPEVLAMIARHHQTGEKLPADLRDKAVAARNFQAGLALMRQLEFAMFDMLIHRKEMNEQEVQNTLDEVRRKVSVLLPPSYNKFQNGFSHIFGGGYAAGYYSYKWAEMLSSDAFCAFLDRGVFDQSLAKRYLDTVLSLGASQKMDQIYRDFLGREPDPASILKLDGLV